METERTQTSTTVNEKSVADLPVNGRNFIDFTVLTPGVVKDPTRTTGVAPVAVVELSTDAATITAAANGTTGANISRPGSTPRFAASERRLPWTRSFAASSHSALPGTDCITRIQISKKTGVTL